eukprot:SAG31_NODE_16671_length_700_cov_1.349418_2_plen_64_part_01
MQLLFLLRNLAWPAEMIESVIPTGWQQAELSSGRTFFFQTAEPTKIFWELPVTALNAVPMQDGM